jgi:outer membrane protein TolC
MNAQQIKAIYTYEQTFIKAFTEVLNQLTYIKNLKEMYDLKSKQIATLSESLEISDILFKAARVEYLDLLLTRRDYLESQMELVEIKRQYITSYVNLYKALGGGWNS